MSPFFYKKIKSQTKCKECSLDASPVSSEEYEMMQEAIPKWSITKEDGVRKIYKKYSFNNFRKALDFTIKVGELAEKHDHHPELITSWGEVTVFWWSHGIKDLTLKDLDLAAGTEDLY
jgi:4a-hydroxytetrahydrobiopterin dehydratase